MRIRTLCCAAALALMLTNGAGATDLDRTTRLTFSGPVQLPGVTLAAGTYTFKLADLEGRHMVQIYNSSNSLITTVMTLPYERRETPKDDQYVMFEERAAGSPKAIKAWFYPGNSIGEEFIYPEPQAAALARVTDEPVAEKSVSHAATASPAPVIPRDESRENRTASARTRQRTSEPAASASQGNANQQRTPPAATNPKQSDPTRTDERRLPQTASPIALMALLSGLALAGGLGARQLRKHR